MGNTWNVVLATVVIFGAGVVTGGLVVSHADQTLQNRPNRQHFVPLWPPPGRMVQGPPEGRASLDRQTTEFLFSVSRELGLSAEQSNHIEQIVREGQELTRATWAKVLPELRKEMDDVREKVRAELTSEQRDRFDELLRQRQRRRPDEMPGGPGRGERGFRQGQPPRFGPRGGGPRPEWFSSPTNPPAQTNQP